MSQIRFGENNGNQKLTWEKVDAIRSSAGKITQVELADIYGVSRSTIARIIYNKTWKEENRQMKIKFREWICEPVYGRYPNGRLGIQLVDKEGMPVAKVTVNLPDYELRKDHIFVKDWSENEGMAKALEEAGYIDEIIDYHPTGHVFALECKLSKKALIHIDNNE